MITLEQAIEIAKSKTYGYYYPYAYVEDSDSFCIWMCQKVKNEALDESIPITIYKKNGEASKMDLIEYYRLFIPDRVPDLLKDLKRFETS